MTTDRDNGNFWIGLANGLALSALLVGLIVYLMSWLLGGA